MWNYKISFMAPEGEEVAEGDRVLGFDSSELDQRLQHEFAERDAAGKRVEKAEQEGAVYRQRAVMALAEAEATYRKSTMKLDRPQFAVSAREQEQVRLDLELSEKEVDFRHRQLNSSEHASEATLAALRAQLGQAEQQVLQTQASIAQMMRRAPRAGTVVYVPNWRDEKKKIGDVCWRGEEVIELPDLNLMKALGQVNEADAGAVDEGQRVSFRLDAHPDIEFGGRVAKVWRSVQKESWRSSLKIVKMEVELDETDRRKMRPGMRLRGEIETERIEDVVLVPVDAVFLKTDGPVVYRRTWLGYERVPVELGRRNDERVEVTSGLSAGDTISQVDLERRGVRS
jgi:RND family efflux transporter MFP subunit